MSGGVPAAARGFSGLAVSQALRLTAVRAGDAGCLAGSGGAGRFEEAAGCWAG